MGFDSAAFQKASKEALPKASRYLKDELGRWENLEVDLKDDKGFVTRLDLESESLAKPIFEKYLPDIPTNGEETGKLIGKKESTYLIELDPLDGTMMVTLGGNDETVIAGARTRGSNQWLAAATMSPMTGRFWYSELGEGTWFNVYNYDKSGWEYGSDRRMKVRDVELSGSMVLVDAAHPYRRETADGKHKQVLGRDERRKLSNNIEDLGAREFSMGSNGYHYAALASGRPRLAGLVTTAIGGPWDLAGMLHVKESGGCSRAFSVNHEARKIDELPKRYDILEADLVIAAPTEENLEKLSCAVVNCKA